MLNVLNVQLFGKVWSISPIQLSIITKKYGRRNDHHYHHHHQNHHEQHLQNVATVGKNLGSYSRLAVEMKEVSGQFFDNLRQDHDFSPLCITLVAFFEREKYSFQLLRMKEKIVCVRQL